MTDDWLAAHSTLADRIDQNIKDRMTQAMEAGGKTQRQMGKDLGWDEAKVSKTLRGSRTPTAADITAWAQVAGESRPSYEETLRLLKQLQDARKSVKDRLKRSRADNQKDINDLYANCSRFRLLQSTMLPGILQISQYARQIFTDLNEAYPDIPRDVDADVQARMARAQYLYDTSKRFEIILAESVLRFAVADPPVMRLQLDRLISVSSMPNVRFGIIPQMRRIHNIIQGGFMIYDDTVIVEGAAGMTVYRGEEARVYKSMMDRHWADAVENDEARALIREVMDEFAAL